MVFTVFGWMYTVLSQELYPDAVTLKMWFPTETPLSGRVPAELIMPATLLSIYTMAPGTEVTITVPNVDDDIVTGRF